MKITEINFEDASLIKQAVKNAFGTERWNSVETLTRGLSPSSLYKLKIKDNYYVAKISDPNNPHNNLDREYHAQSNGAKNKVAPGVHYSDPKDGIIIMDYVEMSTLDKVAQQNPTMIKKFASFVKRLHSCDDFQKDHSIYRRVEIVHDLLPQDFQESHLIKCAMQIKDDVQKQLTDEADLKPCHSDMNSYNLLYDGGGFWLVDWAAAAQENFYFDLASCVMFFYFQNSASADAFLKAYFERSLSQIEMDKFHLMQSFVYVYFGLMFLFISCARKVELLSQEEIDKLPSYQQFMESIGAGRVNLSDSNSQQQLGFICLKMAVSAYNTQAFNAAVVRLQSISRASSSLLKDRLLRKKLKWDKTDHGRNL